MAKAADISIRYFSNPEAERAMAEIIAKEIDDDLVRVLNEEIELAQRKFPYPHVTWDEGTNSYSAFGLFDPASGALVGVACGSSTWDYTYTVTEYDDADLGETLPYRIEVTVAKLFDGLTAMQCFEKYEAFQRGEGKGDKLTEMQLAAAKDEWTRQIKEKKAAAQK